MIVPALDRRNGRGILPLLYDGQGVRRSSCLGAPLRRIEVVREFEWNLPAGVETELQLVKTE